MDKDRKSRRPTAPLLAIAAALLLPACAADGPLKPGRSYPTGMLRTEPSNIQLVRSARSVRMTNTTANSFGPSTIWLNQWYSARIDGLPIGDSVRIRLSRFTDEFGDAFRGGGFFAAESPDLIVKAELETELPPKPGQLGGSRELVPLIVVGDPD